MVVDDGRQDGEAGEGIAGKPNVSAATLRRSARKRSGRQATPLKMKKHAYNQSGEQRQIITDSSELGGTEIVPMNNFKGRA